MSMGSSYYMSLSYGADNLKGVIFKHSQRILGPRHENLTQTNKDIHNLK